MESFDWTFANLVLRCSFASTSHTTFTLTLIANLLMVMFENGQLPSQVTFVWYFGLVIIHRPGGNSTTTLSPLKYCRLSLSTCKFGCVHLLLALLVDGIWRSWLLLWSSKNVELCLLWFDWQPHYEGTVAFSIAVTTGIITNASATSVHWWWLWGEGHWPRLICTPTISFDTLVTGMALSTYYVLY